MIWGEHLIWYISPLNFIYIVKLGNHCQFPSCFALPINSSTVLSHHQRKQKYELALFFVSFSPATVDAFEQAPGGSFKRIASTSSVIGSIIGGSGNVYSNVWKALQLLANDATSSVTELAKKLISFIKHKVKVIQSCKKNHIDNDRIIMFRAVTRQLLYTTIGTFVLPSQNSISGE